MKIITLVAVIGILLLDVAGGIPQSSVGGPMTLLLVYFLAMLVVGLHDAWTHNRGILGWLTSLTAAIAGGFVAIYMVGVLSESLIVTLDIEGPLATSQHPLRYVLSVVMILAVLFGSWGALTLLKRIR